MIDNELEMYYGDDVKITDKITVTQPTVMQIKNFGEKDYFNAVYNLTSVGADLKWQLWDMGIDYTFSDKNWQRAANAMVIQCPMLAAAFSTNLVSAS